MRIRGQPTLSCDLVHKARPLTIYEREQWDQYFELLARRRRDRERNIVRLPAVGRRGTMVRICG